MSQQVVPYVKQAKAKLEEATKLPGLSDAVRSSLKDFAEELDNALDLQLTDKYWHPAIDKSARVQLPDRGKKTERKILVNIYETFKDREFSEYDIKEHLKRLALSEVVSWNSILQRLDNKVLTDGSLLEKVLEANFEHIQIALKKDIQKKYS